MAEPGTLGPLDGGTMPDLATLPPVAACTVLHAELGADVILVKPLAQKGRPALFPIRWRSVAADGR